MEPIDSVAPQLRALRALRGLSQRGLAQKSGVSRSYLARLELGQQDPTVSIVRKLAAALAVPVAVLLEPPARPLRRARPRPVTEKSTAPRRAPQGRRERSTDP
jgi:transcriptional regulator with XRE-family HTH domain